MKILAILLVLLSGCTTLVHKPSESQLAEANYGPYPSDDELRKEIRSYLITRDYYDPMSAQVERCQNDGEHYEDVFDYEANKSRWHYGYKITCYVNVKNRLGGYTGFVRNGYFYSDGQIKLDYVNNVGRAFFGNRLF